MTISIKHQKNSGLLPDWTQTVLDDVIAGNPPPLPPAGTNISSIVLPSDFAADHVIDTTGASNGDVLTVVSGQAEWATPSAGSPAGSNTQIQYNNAGAFGASDRFTFANFQSVKGLESTIVVPPLTATLDGIDVGGNYLDGSTVKVRLYPYVEGAIDYYFDPDVFWEVEVEGNIGNDFYIRIIDIEFTGADGWVAVNNIDDAGWLGFTSLRSDNIFDDYGDEYAPVDTDALGFFVKERQKSAEFDGEVILKGATSGNGGRLVFQSNAVDGFGDAGGKFSLESPPAVFSNQPNQRLILPSYPSGTPNGILSAQNQYAGSGEWVSNLVWADVASLAAGVFWNLTTANQSNSFGSNIMNYTAPATAVPANVLVLTCSNAATSQVGHGSALQFQAQNSTGAQILVGRITNELLDPVQATRRSRMTLFTASTVNGNGIRLSNAVGTANQNVGINGNEITGNILTVYAGAPTNVGSVIRAAVSQTANLQEWQNSAGTVLSSVAANGNISVPDQAYGAGWNGSLEVPTKNAIYDKIETMGGGVTESFVIAMAVAL